MLITTVIEAQARKRNEDKNRNSGKIPYNDKKGNSDKTNLGTRESGFPTGAIRSLQNLPPASYR
jgi:hypothetical protein